MDQLFPIQYEHLPFGALAMYDVGDKRAVVVGDELGNVIVANAGRVLVPSVELHGNDAAISARLAWLMARAVEAYAGRCRVTVPIRDCHVVSGADGEPVRVLMCGIMVHGRENWSDWSLSARDSWLPKSVDHAVSQDARDIATVGEVMES